MESSYKVKLFDKDIREWVTLKEFDDLDKAKEFYRIKNIEILQSGEFKTYLHIEEEVRSAWEIQSKCGYASKLLL